MLTVQELRIGNWILDFGDGAGKVTQIYDGDILTTANPVPQPEETFYPIPLTAELLIKCGFKFNANHTWLELAIGGNVDGQQQHLSATKMTPKEECAVVLLNGYNEQGMDAFDVAEAFADLKREDHPQGVSYIEKSSAISIRHCEYLHQLQNLVFCLTGKEINIDL